MKLGYELTIEQTQKLVMTPELIQAIQILQFNSQEMEAYVEEQLLTNPMLEKSDNQEESDQAAAAETSADQEQDSFDSGEDTEIDWAEHFKNREYDDISYSQWQHRPDSNEYSYEQFLTTDTTLTEHLMFQLQLTSVEPECKRAAMYLIEALDENGYLTVTLEEAALVLGIDADKAEEALRIIQGFDPTGVGARSLAECLLIQMAYYGDSSRETREIIENHLEDIASNRLVNISKAVGISVKEVQEISDIIKTLEPKPGRQFGSFGENRYIIPDVTVEKVDGEYIVTVKDTTAPRLNISPFYQKILIKEDKESRLSRFLTGRLNSALWLIKSIEQRRQTIYNVVSAVVKYQEDFFEMGQKHLKTLTLRQIADELGVHESTVSRSINGKYVETPRGMYEIKYFFTSGVQGSDGLGIASESIKTIIREIVNREDPKSPFSDQVIAKMLEKRGIDISRRTVAKYRDEMNLPSSSKRKRY
jgi:RNA polymerase sigma-54 factor